MTPHPDPERPPRLTRLDRRSAAGPFPAGRYADPPKHPSGEGERILPEKMSGWSYHQTQGFQLIDFPFGRKTPRTVREGLEANDFEAEPSRVIGSGVHRMEVYDRRSTVEHLVIVFSDGLEQLVLCKGFPALLEFLRLYAPVVEKCGKPPADESKKLYDQGAMSVQRLREVQQGIADHVKGNPAEAGERYAIHVAGQVAAEHLTLEKALTLTPKVCPASINAQGSVIPLYHWTEAGWVKTAAPGLHRGTPRTAETRYRVVAPGNRLLKEGVPLAEVLAMKDMPHDCHNAVAYVVGDPEAVPILVYNAQRKAWVDPD